MVKNGEIIRESAKEFVNRYITIGSAMIIALIDSIAIILGDFDLSSIAVLFTGNLLGYALIFVVILRTTIIKHHRKNHQ